MTTPKLKILYIQKTPKVKRHTNKVYNIHIENGLLSQILTAMKTKNS